MAKSGCFWEVDQRGEGLKTYVVGTIMLFWHYLFFHTMHVFLWGGLKKLILCNLLNSLKVNRELYHFIIIKLATSK